MKMTYALSTNSLLSDQIFAIGFWIILCSFNPFSNGIFAGRHPGIFYLVNYMTIQFKKSFVFLIYFSSLETCTFIIIFPRTRMSLFHWFNFATWLPSKSVCATGKLLCTAISRNHNPIFKKQIGVSVIILRVYQHPCWGPRL